MITENDKVELKAVISTVGTDNFDISITEILVDTKWQKLKVAKPLNILLADYDTTVLTDEEKALAKTVIAKVLSSLTGDDLVTATSLNSKL
ncbi:MAG: hypothetical protein K0Q53_79 [Massilibacillus sp.]|jgi:hypothetical protein|nr:hypothetical protein [Massilibacillus sp.]